MEIMRRLTKKEKEFFKRVLLLNPSEHLGYLTYRVNVNGVRRRFKHARIVLQLHLGKYLESWELVCHKDGDRRNDAIENLEVLNRAQFNVKCHISGKKPKGWKPANTTKPEVIERINQIASGMVKVNCSEISRILKKEKIKIVSATVKTYL